MTQDSSKRLPRIFIQHFKSDCQYLDMTEDVMHYVSRVLRLENGHTVWVCNGQGFDFPATLEYLGKKSGRFCLKAEPADRLPLELARRIHVVQALPEADKMEWVIEKATELGAAAFWPVQAQRSVVKLTGNRANKKTSHWQKVAASAMLQCGRGVLPAVHAPAALADTLHALRQAEPTVQIVWFDPAATLHLHDWARGQATGHTAPQQALAICIGPEGGWAEFETQSALEVGATALRFAQRVLRTETFALACLAQLAVLLGLGG
ncbi:MAG: 16S rRNA (uracil(1498)-N(3))-methyltransferase [Limnobacter sp.]|nr:16S rRNA (uracil(1498)-N(3))-methyltransferase [Limnobacter sp.]